MQLYLAADKPYLFTGYPRCELPLPRTARQEVDNNKLISMMLIN